MIIAKDFVYLHVPKTGGTFVTEVLLEIGRQLPNMAICRLQDRKHAGFSRIPEEHNGKPVLLNVRNPFDHYVSRYEFGWWRENSMGRWKNEEVKRRYPEFPKLSFRDFLHLFNDWETRAGLPASSLRTLKELEIGMNTRVLAKYITKSPLKLLREADQRAGEPRALLDARLVFLKQETLNKELSDFLCGIGVPRGICQDFVESQDPILPKFSQAARLNHFFDYYDDDDLAFVRRRDRLIFRLFPHYDQPDEERPAAGTTA